MNSDPNQAPEYQRIEVRKGQVTEMMPREAFRERFMARFYDPAFRTEDEALTRLEAIAWDAYSSARKSPITEKARAGFQDPDYDLSVEWRAASDWIKAAQTRQQERTGRSRVLIINASARNDYTCPGEMSRVEKGDELGVFQYGGSTCCLVSERDVVDAFVPQAPFDDNAPPIKVNTRIATAR